MEGTTPELRALVDYAKLTAMANFKICVPASQYIVQYENRKTPWTGSRSVSKER